MKICIIGKGSIGKRHAKIFRKLGFKIFFMRSKKKFLEKNDFFKINEIKKINFDLYCICNPSSEHLNTLKKIVYRNMNVLIEKPIVTNLRDLKKIISLKKKYKINLFSGYMLRFDPRINLIKDKIKKKNIRYANFIWQTYMPSWHPYENYRNSYASQKKLGGGVLLTCSHEIDLAIQLFGYVEEVFCIENKSTIKTNVDNSVNLFLRHNRGINSNITLDFSSKWKTKREIDVIGNDFSYKWDFYKSFVEEHKKRKSKKIFPKKKSHIDEIYKYQNLKIINWIKKKKDYGHENLHTEKVLIALRKSLKINKVVKI